MSGIGRPRLALVAHRLAARTATGVGRYSVELIGGLAAAPGLPYDLVAATTREQGAQWPLPHVERRTIPGPRKLVTLGWGTIRWPRVDRALGHPALVHALHAWAPVPTRAPLVVTVHDVMPLRHPDWYGRIERWSFRRAIDHSAAHASAIIADSATEAAQLAERTGIGADRIRVVALGVGDEFRQRPSDQVQRATCARHGVEPGRYVVSLGAVSARKNLSVVLRALALVAPGRLGTPALLVIGPSGVGADAIEAEVAALGLEARVRFAGYVTDQDVPVLVGSSLLMAHPSRDEGFGLTPLEAMAAGTPVLVSRSGSLPEVTGPGAVLLDPDDPDAWAEAITQVASDPDRRAELIAAGDRHQAAYTWERTASATLDVYAEVLGRQ